VQDIVLGEGARLEVAADGRALHTAERGECDRRFRIRKVDLQAKTVTTVVIGAELPARDAPAPLQLQSFLSPTAMAQSADGTLLIADSDVFTGGLTISSRDRPGLGNGVWALSPAGQLTQLAGFAHPSTTPMADGKGADAVFESINALCTGAQGEFYVLDRNRVRRVGTDGMVTTLAGADYRELHCGRDGRSLTSVPMADGRRKVHALPSGQMLGAVLDSNMVLLAQDSERTAWAYTPGDEKVFLMDLDSGKALPDSALSVARGRLLVDGRAYTVYPVLQSAEAGVAYLPSAYGIVQLTYR
jgi:hypothetical protein